MIKRKLQCIRYDYYSLFLDIRDLIQVDDVMSDDSLQLGPNGGLVFCME